MDTEDKNPQVLPQTNLRQIFEPELTDMQFLGRGGEGTVMSGSLKGCNSKVAVKKLICQKVANSKMTQSDRQALNEAQLLHSINHINIVKIMGFVDLTDAAQELWIVTELIDGGSLGPYCLGTRQFADEADKMKVAADSWTGLAHLHTSRITHRDIKPENILVQLDNAGKRVVNAKLVDFGVSQLRQSISRTRKTEHCFGTIAYMAPELMEFTVHYKQADVYALGVTLCELFTQKDFWQKDGHRAIDENIIYSLGMINEKINLFEAENSKADESILSPDELKKNNFWPDGLDYLDETRLAQEVKNMLKKCVNFRRKQRPSSADEARDVFEKYLTQ